MPVTDLAVLALLNQYLQSVCYPTNVQFSSATYDINSDTYDIVYTAGGARFTGIVSSQTLHHAQYSPAGKPPSMPISYTPGAITPVASTGAISQAYYGGSVFHTLGDLYPPPPKALKCECGAVKCGQPRHSSWCDLYSV